jgi:DNA mismatch repair protein MSH6
VFVWNSLFSTHYHLLTDEFNATPNVRLQLTVDVTRHCAQVRLMHMSANVDDTAKRVTFLYKLVKGVCPKSYGVSVVDTRVRMLCLTCVRVQMHVARMADVPDAVVDQADRISHHLETVFAFAKIAKMPALMSP